MDNKALLFDLQKRYLWGRSEVALTKLLQEVGRLARLIQNDILKSKSLFFTEEKKEDNIQAVLLYFVERYNNPSFRVETSFHSVIWYKLTNIIFGKKAKKDDNISYFPHHDMIDIASDQEYQESSCVMSLIEREMEKHPDIKPIVEEIFDSGKPWERYLYKIKPKEKRDQVERFMLDLKEKIYEEGEVNAAEYMQLSRV